MLQNMRIEFCWTKFVLSQSILKLELNLKKIFVCNKIRNLWMSFWDQFHLFFYLIIQVEVEKKSEKKFFFFHFFLLNWKNDAEELNSLCSKLPLEYREFSWHSGDVFRFFVRCMVMKVLISKWYQKIYMTHHNEHKYCHILNILRRTVIIRRLLDS